MTQAWQLAAKQVWEYLQQGQDIAADEGEIGFYSTLTYLAQTLQQMHPAAVIECVSCSIDESEFRVRTSMANLIAQISTSTQLGSRKSNITEYGDI